jgi:hypothetical protein
VEAAEQCKAAPVDSLPEPLADSLPEALLEPVPEEEDGSRIVTEPTVRLRVAGLPLDRLRTGWRLHSCSWHRHGAILPFSGGPMVRETSRDSRRGSRSSWT